MSINVRLIFEEFYLETDAICGAEAIGIAFVVEIGYCHRSACGRISYSDAPRVSSSANWIAGYDHRPGPSR